MAAARSNGKDQKNSLSGNSGSGKVLWNALLSPVLINDTGACGFLREAGTESGPSGLVS